MIGLSIKDIEHYEIVLVYFYVNLFDLKTKTSFYFVILLIHLILLHIVKSAK